MDRRNNERTKKVKDATTEAYEVDSDYDSVDDDDVSSSASEEESEDEARMTFEKRLSKRRDGFADEESSKASQLRRQGGAEDNRIKKCVRTDIGNAGDASCTSSSDSDSEDSDEEGEQHEDDVAKSKKGVRVRKKRKNKNAPMVMSSKKTVSRYRQVVDVPKKRKFQDPRFLSWTGDVKGDLFRKSYEFLKDYSESEIRTLKKEMKKSKDSEDVRAMQAMLTRLQQYRTSTHRDEATDLQQSKWRRLRREQLRKGKRPYYPKKRELRDEQLREQFDQLEKSGRLDKAMAKRMAKKQRKNAQQKRGKARSKSVPWAS